VKKIIWVYGFTGYNKQTKTARKILDNYNLICFEYNSRLNQPLEKIAEELDKFITSKTRKNEKIDLIGVSAGGLIASYYTKFISPGKVDKIATICSPFKGSYLPFFYSQKRKGLKDLLYESKFLKNLNSRKVGKNKTINFFSYLDPLVPGKSGKGENPIHTWNFNHFFVHSDKKILKRIQKFFNKK
jgi:hypothetical protein